MNDVKLFKKFTYLRDLLQVITQISFNYSLINKKFPLRDITDEKIKDIISLYEDLFKKIKKLNDEYEKSRLDKTI